MALQDLKTRIIKHLFKNEINTSTFEDVMISIQNTDFVYELNSAIDARDYKAVGVAIFKYQHSKDFGGSTKQAGEKIEALLASENEDIMFLNSFWLFLVWSAFGDEINREDATFFGLN